MSAWLRIGTRGSALALAQASETRRLIAVAHGRSEDEIELVVIKTTGDLIQDRALAEAGGKGLFTKELDSALLEGKIDLAVHSAKDLPTELPDGLTISGYLPREDVRDAFISAKAKTLADLPPGASVGTASLRRQAQLKRLRPDLNVTLLRGNVDTRLRRVEAGEIDATLLALAGLKRLGFDHRATAVLDLAYFLPAVGQGAIALVTREAQAIQDTLQPVTDRGTGLAVTAERAFLRVLDGSCRTPIAGYAQLSQGRIQMRGQLLKPDGSDLLEASFIGREADAERIGTDTGLEIRRRMPADYLTA
ncbi:hydroxymethylbilane synthase [Methylovirgula sp. 4M-Z18]|uniref:hydroxymethylbilane synthase n=1 Tax=Methylovirgula sp. 4M-Z18 TaxID=2293567 RepID=UPI000E2FDEDF|nr:hydroxymethylbilane synthase [Methylovirgula sp. 4M-Z18]RFB78203.1 hydroxymethylbilane synthase [Methylovirgula sp. 4M-Z18]